MTTKQPEFRQTILKKLPLMAYFIAKGQQNYQVFGFDSLDKINRIYCPILLIHAENDKLVSVEQGKELYYKTMPIKGIKSNGYFHAFPGSMGYGHIDIIRAENLADSVIANFIKQIGNKPKAGKQVDY